MATLPEDNHWLMIGTESLAYKWFKGTNVRFELELEKLRRPDEGKHIFPLIPILASGKVLTSLPWYKQRSSMIDFTENSYATNMKELIFHLTRLPKTKYELLWEDFERGNDHYLKKLDDILVQEIVKIEKQIEKETKEIIGVKQQTAVSNYLENIKQGAEKKI